MHGQPPQPPQPGDDHQAQIAVYQPILQLLAEAGLRKALSISSFGTGVLQIQSQMMQDEQEKAGQSWSAVAS